MNSLSRMLWDGEYGNWFGFAKDGALARAEKATGITRATAYYSIACDFAWWQAWYWPLRTVAFRRLVAFLRSRPFTGCAERLSAGDCETAATHALWLSAVRWLPRRWRDELHGTGVTLVRQGLSVMDENTSPHTRAFLYLHESELYFKMEWEGQPGSSGRYPGMQYGESCRHDADALFKTGVAYAFKVSNPDQRARCFRHVAKICARYATTRDGKETARHYMNFADGVPGTSKSVRRKNALARKRLGL